MARTTAHPITMISTHFIAPPPSRVRATTRRRDAVLRLPEARDRGWPLLVRARSSERAGLRLAKDRGRSWLVAFPPPPRSNGRGPAAYPRRRVPAPHSLCVPTDRSPATSWQR